MAEGRIAALTLNEANHQKAAKGEAISPMQETVIPPLQAEVEAGHVRKQQEVAVMRQRGTAIEPPAKDDGRPVETVEVKTYAEMLCTPSMCVRRSV